MSAAVCGSKRSLFEELPPSPPVSKRLRCSSSPIRLSLPSLIDHLRSLFPHMDDQVLERALQECGNDLDAAIKSLHGLCLGSADDNSQIAPQPDLPNVVHTGTLEENDDASASGDQPASGNFPADGAEWIDLFVREMTCATSVDDARSRAARLLEVLEKSITAHASSGATTALQREEDYGSGNLETGFFDSVCMSSMCPCGVKGWGIWAEWVDLNENLMLKEQIEALTKEKNCFKSAFRIQLERLSDYENKNQELQQLKQLVSQYQEQIRTLEVNNYALRMHLNQAQQYNPFPGRFPPDAF
ncbi:hypothetical protein JHK84_041299 [Glycine max]|nr:hypothetical protein JHK86_041093 [Glycine max]KAG5115186.1 hypothetical protein JHK84_041299 [Glycine max]